MITDAQVHIWSEPGTSNAWPSWGETQAKRHRPQGPLDLRKLLEMMEAGGVDQAVLVPPSFQGDDNSEVVDAVRQYPHRFRAMGRVPLTDEESGRMAISDIVHSQEMLGVRLTFAGPTASWLHDGTADWIWSALSEARLPSMVFAPGLTKDLDLIASSFPELKLLVDHLGIASDTRTDNLIPLLGDLIPLARHPNVAVKASALPCFTTEAFPFPNLQRTVRLMVDTFGRQRVFWGTDLSRLPCSYREAVEFLTNADILDSDELEWVMGRGVREWLGWC